MLFFLTLIGCSEALLSEPVSANLGKQLCQLGHPKATCGEGTRHDWAGGGLVNKSKKDRWLDIAVPYTRKTVEHMMVVRVRVKKVSPCRVAVNVQSDSGPNPVLLDNGVTSRIVGEVVCSKLGL
jgi:hypothetical protein